MSQKYKSEADDEIPILDLPFRHYTLGQEGPILPKNHQKIPVFMLGFEPRTQKRSLILSGFEPLTSDIFHTF